MKNSKKGFIVPLVIIGILLIVAAGAYYFAMQKNTPEVVNDSITTAPAGWKIYKNDQYSFTFQYPSDYTLTNQDPTPPKNLSQIITINPNFKSTDSLRIDIRPGKVVKNQSNGICSPSTDGTIGKQNLSAIKTQCGDVGINSTAYQIQLNAITVMTVAVDTNANIAQAIPIPTDVLNSFLNSFEFSQQSMQGKPGPSITIINPKGGEVFHAGQTVDIQWQTHGLSTIYLSLVNGGKDHGQLSLKGILATQGHYMWTVPEVSGYASGYGGGYKILIDDNTTDGVSAVSPSFSIQK